MKASVGGQLWQGIKCREGQRGADAAHASPAPEASWGTARRLRQRRTRQQAPAPRGAARWACEPPCCALLRCAQMTVPEAMVWLRRTTTMPLRMK